MIKKRRIIVNDKKGCTQTAYVGSLVTMLVLHVHDRQGFHHPRHQTQLFVIRGHA